MAEYKWDYGNHLDESIPVFGLDFEFIDKINMITMIDAISFDIPDLWSMFSHYILYPMVFYEGKGSI